MEVLMEALLHRRVCPESRACAANHRGDDPVQAQIGLTRSYNGLSTVPPRQSLQRKMLGNFL